MKFTENSTTNFFIELLNFKFIFIEFFMISNLQQIIEMKGINFLKRQKFPDCKKFMSHYDQMLIDKI